MIKSLKRVFLSVAVGALALIGTVDTAEAAGGPAAVFCLRPASNNPDFNARVCMQSGANIVVIDTLVFHTNGCLATSGTFWRTFDSTFPVIFAGCCNTHILFPTNTATWIVPASGLCSWLDYLTLPTSC